MSALTHVEQPWFQRSSARPESDAGRLIDLALHKAMRHARNHAADWRTRAKGLIEELAAEYSKPGWDGYGAKPISDAARNSAHAVVDMFPLRFPEPDVVPDADGEIALVWDFGPGFVFTLSAGTRGKLSLAGLLGNGVRRHGVEPFVGEIPQVVVDAIEELCRRAGAAC